jgi:hypothetical protein
LVVTKAGPVSVRVVVVELVAVVLVVWLAVALVLELDVPVGPGVVEELELLVEAEAALGALELVLGVVVTVTVGGLLEPQAASVAASTTARPMGVAVVRIFIGRCVGSRSQSLTPAVIVRKDGSESDDP